MASRLAPPTPSSQLSLLKQQPEQQQVLQLTLVAPVVAADPRLRSCFPPTHRRPCPHQHHCELEDNSDEDESEEGDLDPDSDEGEQEAEEEEEGKQDSQEDHQHFSPNLGHFPPKPNNHIYIPTQDGWISSLNMSPVRGVPPLCMFPCSLCARLYSFFGGLFFILQQLLRPQ